MKLVCALITIILAVPASAAVFHVAASGRDSARGTPQDPFRTLSRGVRAAGPGDTVLVRDGAYGHENAVTGGDSADYAASPVVLRRSGTPSRWITIKAENKWGAILDCEMRCDSYIDLRNAAYVLIQDFVITRGYKEGIHSNDAAHHIVLRGNRIEKIANRASASRLGMDGMYTGPECHDFVIDGNVFTQIGRTSGPHNLDHGLYLRGANFTVTNNSFSRMLSGWAIQLADGLSNVLIADNIFLNSNTRLSGHIMLWRKQTNIVIRNNLFSKPHGHPITRYESAIDGCLIEGNRTEGFSEVMIETRYCTMRNNRRTGALWIE